MKNNTSAILFIAFATESALAISALLWTWLRHIPLDVAFTAMSVVSALTGCFFLSLLNILTFNRHTLKIRIFAEAFEFIKQFVVPLAQALSWPSALFVACCAGVGEELFFRGCIEPECGWIISNIAFALIHFGRASLKYPLLVVVYFCAGSILSAVKWHSGGLSAPILAHIAFDFISLTYIKHKFPCNLESQ